MKEILYEALAGAGHSLDFAGVERWGNRLGSLLWTALRERRSMAEENMVYHLGVTSEQARTMTRNNFRNTGRSFLELFLSKNVDKRFVKDRLTISDPESFQALVETDRPFVGTSAHLGAWELMIGLYHVLIPERKKQVVVRRPKDEALHKLMTRMRTNPTVEVVEHRQAVLKVLRCLKKGGATGFMVDHNCSTTEAVYLPFLKKIAAVNMGPALLAIRSEALIQPLYLLRDEENGFILHTEHALDTRVLTGSREEKIQKAALFYTQSVERAVHRWPEQWYWLHRRWKTQPPPEWNYIPPENMK
ncbi:lysophospholipid acyltransferase family protein [Desulfovibrio ferrophilus]|uniref:Lipid A biosynthesis acyltransferase n=1 Tax=Desulfovibrio ferrophilus TaxID=241368 RepID=A0A2Z6AWT2_9BACT|nr:lysophospholipid acyltransferase family protein [Desulfovibrio ferrophilus]BBD07691.1 lipid A biosynthesis acyltransferase [Desulfovibrio ferrophilus]